MWYGATGASALLAYFAFAASAQASACGRVSIAEMNWNSAAIAAQVDKLILEAGYGCDVELVAGDTIPTVRTMINQGTPDIAPELWVNSVNAELNEAYASGKLVQGAEILADGAVEGWWIPKYVADEHPNLRTIADALAKPELFAENSESRQGVVHSCPPDWSCSITTQNLFRATGAESKGFSLKPAGSAEEFNAGLSRALNEKRGWLGYYWAPTAILGEHPMVKLSFGVPFDQLEWDECTSRAGCANPKINSYPVSQAFTIISKGLSDRAPDVTDYLRNRKWGNATISSLMAWQAENNASNRDAALHFLRQNLDIWTRWVPVSVLDRIKPTL